MCLTKTADAPVSQKINSEIKVVCATGIHWNYSAGGDRHRLVVRLFTRGVSEKNNRGGRVFNASPGDGKRFPFAPSERLWVRNLFLSPLFP